MEHLFLQHLKLCASFLKQLQSQKGERGVPSLYVNEVTSGKPLRMGACWEGNQPWLEGWNFQPHPQPPETEERLEIQSVTNGQSFNLSSCVKKPPQKPTGTGLGGFPSRWTHTVPEEGMGACIPSHIPCLRSFFHLAVPELSIFIISC